MPTYPIDMLEGRTLEPKKKRGQATTRVRVEVLGGPPDTVGLLTTAVLRDPWATGDRLWPERN